jgi:hypothetical protein
VQVCAVAVSELPAVPVHCLQEGSP